MSLASDYVPSENSFKPPPRWSKMRSQEGSEASVPIGTMATPNDTFDARQVASPTNSMNKYVRSRSEGSFREGRTSECGSFLDNTSLVSGSKVRQKEAVVNNAEIKRICEALGKHAIDNQGSVEVALQELKRDADGNVTRSDLRRWFVDHRIATRMADRFFEEMSPEENMHLGERRNSECIRGSLVDSVFKELIVGHLGRAEGDNRKKHHHHHNVHGLLRPQHDRNSVISIPNADATHEALTKDRLKKIALQMTGRSQRRYVDKYGNIDRQDMQHLFESYGLTPEQSNQFFSSMDKKRNGEVKFVDLRNHLSRYLHCEDKREKKLAEKKAPELDRETMDAICVHVGQKALEKYKSVYSAFRFVDRDNDNKVDRFEVRNFFRNYGSNTYVADRFFDTMDTKRQGKIAFGDFQDKFAMFVQPGYHPARPEDDSKQYQGPVLTTWGESYYQKEGKTPHHMSANTFGVMHGSNTGGRTNPSLGRDDYDELQQNRFGRFEGVSTYQSSYNPLSFGQELPMPRAAGTSSAGGSSVGSRRGSRSSR